MSDSTDKVIASLIQKAMDGVGEAINFSKAQLPDVIEQLMHWKLVSYSLRIFTFALIIAGMCFVFKKGCQWHGVAGKENASFACLLFSSLIILFSLIAMTSSIGNLIELWLAPKVWLLEYASQIMNAK